MPTQIIEIEGIGRGFITKSDDDTCSKGGVHDFSGAVLTYLTRRGEHRYINQEKYLISGTTFPKPEHLRMHIVAGECSCIKCGCPYTSAHNPYFL